MQAAKCQRLTAPWLWATVSMEAPWSPAPLVSFYALAADRHVHASKVITTVVPYAKDVLDVWDKPDKTNCAVLSQAPTTMRSAPARQPSAHHALR